MDSSPNFNNYTLDELLDVQNNIDSKQYPERAKEIELAISNKMNDPAAKAEIEKLQELDKYATFGPRFWASIIDGVVISVLSAILVFLGTQAGGGIQTILGYIDTVQFAVYSVALHTLYGQTFGKMALDVKVVDYLTENHISFKQAFLRDCVPVVMLILLLIASIFVPAEQAGETPDWLIYAMMAFGISYFLWHLLEIITMLFNEKNRALHDFIAGTVVIRT
ncbi:RDD family protein [Colwellia sp. RSH04]|uniref:RDD family protein n=1 Tax=Colwellia sp. RSH04 TaxID=2305464 RepID=UPI000E567653|nr:RDD family protein [Colwellia sp. RSH04]RHW75242.1 RDD family protein [Colwellia sp. RSH04]